ncbi:MAG: nucleotidyl transferase AbiEii/AbiGii toxin family protein [Clostridia bacterium]|nr:nucleotidyl transferase AbiEii/AbiGii toxin family protein [Clostridia bacterium]
MNKALEMMLAKYKPENNTDKENAIKEIVQEIILSGLSKGDFFKRAAFYGGTCLRIFHNLDRFSEDLDFALTDNEDFDFTEYFPFIENELKTYGIGMEISNKMKDEESAVKSAFVKGNTIMLMMWFFPNDSVSGNLAGNQRIKIKFEIDTDNPEGGRTETKYRLLPSPYDVRVFDESTLFAGKIHAILCREYKNRIKGRDYYDYLFYCSKGTEINMTYLVSKLKNSGKIDKAKIVTEADLKAMLYEKFMKTDYELAKEDVSGFIQNQEMLRLWSKELFISTLEELSFTK